MPQSETFTYEIVRKKVKYLSIRITKDARILVTIPMRVSKKQAEEFVKSRQDWIIEKLRQAEAKTVLHVDEQHWTTQKEADLNEIVMRIFPRFAAYGISYPTLKYRKMVSCYGNCRAGKGIVTLNKILADMPKECAEYVVAHELAHLVEANHSKAFYLVLKDVMPDYKNREERLSEYALYH